MIIIIIIIIITTGVDHRRGIVIRTDRREQSSRALRCDILIVNAP